MFLQLVLPSEHFAAFFALEGSLPSVLSFVLLQITRRSGGEVALVTLEWLLSSMCLHVPFQIVRGSASITAPVTLVLLFSCMLRPNVAFQMTSCDAGKLANCATVKFFSRVGPFVQFQVT